MWKFCGKEQFPNSLGRLAQNYAETVPFHKISTPGKITVFFAVLVFDFWSCFRANRIAIEILDKNWQGLYSFAEIAVDGEQ